MKASPIGVFDSGLGGLTVVRQIRRMLPNERIVYFGDIARLPYGIKSTRQIREFSCQNTEFLMHKRVKAIVIACNSSSSAAYSFIRRHYSIPVFDVIRPAAEEAAQVTSNGRIGIIGTQATVHSGAYHAALKRLNPKIKVFGSPCPLLVPIVEEGSVDTKIAEMTVKRYLAPLLQERIDTLILGCTHYPLLEKVIKRVAGGRIRLVDSAPAAVHQLQKFLKREELESKNAGKGSLEVFVSDLPGNFVEIGTRFLGENLRKVKMVRFKLFTTQTGKWVA